MNIDDYQIACSRFQVAHALLKEGGSQSALHLPEKMYIWLHTTPYVFLKFFADGSHACADIRIAIDEDDDTISIRLENGALRGNVEQYLNSVGWKITYDTDKGHYYLHAQFMTAMPSPIKRSEFKTLTSQIANAAAEFGFVVCETKSIVPRRGIF